MTKGLQSAAVNKIISVKYIGTFWALAFGYILFGESYSWLSIIGILLVIVGVVLNLKRDPVNCEHFVYNLQNIYL